MNRLEKLQEFVKRDPGNTFSLYGLAMEYKSLGRHHESRDCFARLLEKHPDYTAAYLHYGTLQFEMGQTDLAIQTFEKGIEVCTDRAEMHARDELIQALNQIRG